MNPLDPENGKSASESVAGPDSRKSVSVTSVAGSSPLNGLYVTSCLHTLVSNLKIQIN